MHMTDADIEALTRRRWGATIRQARSRMDLNQDEFRYHFDPPVSQSTIQRWEAGQVEPRIRHRLQMARIFGVPASVLFPLMDVIAA